MMDARVIESITYDEPKKAISIASDNLVEIIGEQKVEYEGRILNQYIYNIVGYTPKNGEFFVALKSNLALL